MQVLTRQARFAGSSALILAAAASRLDFCKGLCALAPQPVP